MWELALELPPVTLTGRQFVPTDTTRIIHMPAHPTGSMARSGLTVEYLLAPDRGITKSGAVRGIGVAATDAKVGVTTGEESTHVAAMVAAITEVMRTVVTRAATPEATASVAKVVTTVAAAVASTAAVGEASTAAVGEASTEEADPTVADTGNSVMEA